MAAYIFFAKKICLNAERNIKKEILSGVIISLLLCTLFYFQAAITFILVIGYFSIYQMTCMFDNELFFCKKEFDIFAINKFKHYYLIYLLARIAADTIVSNFLVLISVSILLCIQKGATGLVFWLLCCIGNVCLAPCSNMIGEKLGKKAGQVFCTILIALYFLMIVGYINKVSIIVDILNCQSLTSMFWVILFIMCFGVIMIILSKMQFLNTTENKTFHIYNIIKRYDILVFKDYQLLGAKILLPIIMNISILWLLCDKVDSGFNSLFILFCLSSDWINLREKKKFLLLFNDNLFTEDIFPDDKFLLRSRRTISFLLQIPFKLIVCVVAGICFKILSLNFILYALLIFLSNALLEHKRLYRHDFPTIIMNEFVKYFSCVLASLSLYTESYRCFVYIFLILTLAFNFILNRKICDCMDGEDYEV